MPSSAERGRAAPAAAGPAPGEAARARPADSPTFAELARRGAAPVRWHEVSVGDRVPERVKGPLDAATMAAFYAGNGPGTYLPADLRWKLERRAALDPAGLPDNTPLPGQPTADAGASGSGHDDPEAARAAGMPGAFDVGWQRISWMLQALTDWAGDHGRVRGIDVRLGQPDVAGDTVCSARAKVPGSAPPCGSGNGSVLRSLRPPRVLRLLRCRSRPRRRHRHSGGDPGGRPPRAAQRGDAPW